MAVAGKVRIQLNFADLPKEITSFTNKCWFVVDRINLNTIEDLIRKVIDRFQLNVAYGVVQLTLDGCLLPAWETTEVFRDNDSVR